MFELRSKIKPYKYKKDQLLQKLKNSYMLKRFVMNFTFQILTMTNTVLHICTVIFNQWVLNVLPVQFAYM